MTHALATPALAIPPAAGWILKAEKRIFAGGVSFDRGCEIPIETLGKNFQSLVDCGFARWYPPGKVCPLMTQSGHLGVT